MGRSRWSSLAAFALAFGILLEGRAYAVEPAVPEFPETKSMQPAGASAVTIPEMRYEADKLSLKADKADLGALLKKISQAAGVPIEIGPGVEGQVTIEFGGQNLEEGINRILGAAGEKNLATEYTKKPGQKKDEYKIEKILVMRSRTAATPAMKSIVSRDQEYREYFEKMDKEGNKIARVLREYRDPQTSKEEQTRLRTYLRQAVINNPADKKLLEGALKDNKIQGEIISDIQMSLLHAIQDHPEDDDKEFVLELLEKKENNIGWLYYAMLKIWDARYVPYLMDLAKDGRPSAIEILGRAEVKEAVPLLENLLKNHPSENVRAEAIMALRQITGNEYKWQEVPTRVKKKKENW
jgi:hypothetical protein